MMDILTQVKMICSFKSRKVILTPSLLTLLYSTTTILSNCQALDIVNTVKVKRSDYDYHRDNPRYPIKGTNNWKLLIPEDSSLRFTPRFGHATCIFKCPTGFSGECIWLTGGHSDLYQTFDMRFSDKNADVWWSKDGESWHKMRNLKGDYKFGIGNWDAKVPGPVAPWYSRFGHSLNALDANNDGVTDAMVLTGGDSPIPSNDVWISPDGEHWYFDGYAPWSERSHHASALFQGELWIIGGAPLSNDVWAGKLVENDEKESGYSVNWRMMTAPMESPWSPRAGSCATTQLRREYFNETSLETTYKEYLYLIGGFAGFPIGDPRYDNLRTRNDVWVTNNGHDWTRLLPPGKSTMPWVGRAWHGCVTWNDPVDKSIGVNRAALNMRRKSLSYPRIYIAGGGYTGTKGNNVVTRLEGYLDVWWSYDGSSWQKVNYMEGSNDSLYSTSEWAEVTNDSKLKWRGKWGFTLEAFHTSVDLNTDGSIDSDTVSIQFIANDNDPDNIVSQSETFLNENKVPSLFLIGGKFVEDGPYTNDVFLSQPGGKLI